MSFFMEFWADVIRKGMQDPVKRREARDASLRTIAQKADQLCAPPSLHPRRTPA